MAERETPKRMLLTAAGLVRDLLGELGARVLLGSDSGFSSAARAARLQ